MAVLNQFKTVMLLGLLTGLLLGVGFLVGGQQGLLIALIFSVLMNFGTYWFSDRIVLAMYRAKQITHSEAPDGTWICEGGGRVQPVKRENLLEKLMCGHQARGTCKRPAVSP